MNRQDAQGRQREDRASAASRPAGREQFAGANAGEPGTPHQIVRVRHELRRRKLVVSGVESLTPRMRRIRFTSPELADFHSPSPDDHEWVVRGEPSAHDGELLRRALAGFSPPSGDGFVWIAGEASLVHEVRALFAEERRHPSEWIKAASYWHRGAHDGRSNPVK
ncbi:SIP domain-containing protein [Archangium violaceum]|uniref:SIP domain-containing protein n=1 Tax=Archangium violaceum TaxID=83451 RepID=UPI00194EACCD|nr:SIP domain-containing protein [Archangium violaceum]QRN93507.1 SIP domain-containing protein [Archangium violaceum]